MWWKLAACHSFAFLIWHMSDWYYMIISFVWHFRVILISCFETCLVKVWRDIAYSVDASRVWTLLRTCHLSHKGFTLKIQHGENIKVTIWITFIQSPQTVLHTPTALLFMYVQPFVVIWYINFKIQINTVALNLNNEIGKPLWHCPVSYCQVSLWWQGISTPGQMSVLSLVQHK